MSIYDRLAMLARAGSLQEQPTSYFSAPEKELDPRLFTAKQTLKPSVRTRLLSCIQAYLSKDYAGVEQWLTVYLAGSGVSYQWAAAREPGDLDVLLDVDWNTFRQCNPDLRDLGDEELRNHLNHQMMEELWPQTARWEA